MGSPAMKIASVRTAKGTTSHTGKTTRAHEDAMHRLAAVSGLAAAQEVVHGFLRSQLDATMAVRAYELLGQNS